MKSLAIALLLFSTPSVAKTVSGDVTFKGRTTIFEMAGKGGTVNCDIAEKDGMASGTCTVKLADFTTGVDLRDEHMRTKYLETAKYPTATLTLKPWKVSVTPSPFEGTLTIKTDTKPVKGIAQVDGATLNAGFTISLKDYPSIGVPSFKGVAVSDAVEVTVVGTAK